MTKRNALGQRIRLTPFAREENPELEALRDDCIALFINSGLTQKQVSERGGPRPATISKWLYKETKFPRYDTIASFLKALGYKLAVVDSNRQLFDLVSSGLSTSLKRKTKGKTR